MDLLTLGTLRLQQSSFRETLPLLVLTYMALEGPTLRSHLADLIWANNPDTEKRLGSLSEALRRLRGIDRTLVESDTESCWTTVTSDAQALLSGSESSLTLYQGHFLAGIEHRKRIKLGAELTEWITKWRERLFTEFVSSQLAQVERHGLKGEFAQAAERAVGLVKLGVGVILPTSELYIRLHTLLLAGEKSAEAQSVATEAIDLFGSTVPLLKSSAAARGRLTHRTNFRRTFEPLIGVKQAQQAVTEMLSDPDTALVHIVGLGGVGKTALAEAVAREFTGDITGRDGRHIVYFENLPDGASADELYKTVATQLGHWMETPTLHDLAELFSDRQHLLVLDNLEHLPAAANLIEALLDGCPNLKVLSTSRHTLGLGIERTFLLQPLRFPISGAGGDTLYPAVELFVREASKHQHGFTLTETNKIAISEIARRLGGIPLALKLAAAWVKLLSSEEISAALERDLELLTQEGSTPSRHLSVNAALDYSVRFLGEVEARTLANLTVFEAGWTARAALAVAGNPVSLRSLLEKSLVEPHDADARFNFHPLIRRWLLSWVDSEALQVAQEAHKHYYLSLLRRFDPAVPQTDAPKLSELVPEASNLQSAWEKASLQDEYETLLDHCRPLMYFGHASAHVGLVAESLAESLTRCPEDAHGLRAALAGNLSFLRYRLGQHEDALILGDLALSSLEGSNLPETRQKSIARLALTTQLSASSSLAEFDRAFGVVDHLLALVGDEPESQGYMNALVNREVLRKDVLGSGDPTPLLLARRYFATEKNDGKVAWIDYSLADQAFARGAYGEAKAWLGNVLDRPTVQASDYWHSMCLLKLAEVYLAEEDLDAAQALLASSTEPIRSQGSPILLVNLCARRSELERKHAPPDLERAQHYLDEAQRAASQSGEVAVRNGLAIDQIELYLAQGDAVAAVAAVQSLAPQTSRMYARSRQRFEELLMRFPHPYSR